ncbi:protocadherin beta-6-like, partial [Empidonax traillii]|uniref:protocadherin beta-6-like n=1 Tax=Empidonax traillii TaxID=164674 RepID=UPI000FFD4A47
LSLPLARSQPIRYSVAEEAHSGSLVGNLAQDAALPPAQLSARRARLVSEDGRQHFRFDRASGLLVVADRLDREQLCGQADTCTLPFELLLADPLQFFRVEVTLEDINDHSPVFPEERVTFKIPETSDPGSRFPLEVAWDLDVGSNSVQAYSITPENEYFSVSYGSRITGKKSVELVLEKPLDREEQAEMDFSLIAVDGGSPPRSGSAQIHIVVLDVNDNAPVFTQEEYMGKVSENTPKGSVVMSVLATDRDSGINGDITYQFRQAMDHSDSAFEIDPITGEIKLTKPLDFEAAQTHEFSVRATDGGGLSAICKVVVEVLDVNDNAPELLVSSFSSPLAENSAPGTVVALFTVRDRDAGANGKVSCALEHQLFFSLRPAYKNYYELVTVRALDREDTAQHILTVTAADAGSPPLTTTHTFTVDISDVNDNAPVFNQTSYTMYVRENNAPSVLVGAVSAADADVGLNAKVTYSLSAGQAAERPWCSCVSVNPESGQVFVLRALDYEQLRQTAAGTLPRPYCYEISLTTGSDNSEFRFLKPFVPSLPPQPCAVGGSTGEEQAGHVLSGADNLPSGLADAAAAGTLPRPYCYEISLTTGSGNSEFRFLKPFVPSLPPQPCVMGGDTGEEQVFPCVPVPTEDVTPDNSGPVSAEQFNRLSFN